MVDSRALSVATAASAAATAWSQGTQGHAADSDGPAKISREAAGASRLAVTDQLARPVAEAADQQSSATLAQHAFQLRLTQTRDAIAKRQAARKRAAELAASKAAAAARSAATRARAAAQPSQTAGSAAPAASGSPRQIAVAMLGSFG